MIIHKEEVNKCADNIFEFALWMNDEYGESLMSLFDIYQNCSLLNKSFKKALYIEIIEQSKNLDEHFKIVKKEVTKTTTYTDTLVVEI